MIKLVGHSPVTRRAAFGRARWEEADQCEVERIVLFERERYDGDWPSENLAEHVAWLAGLLKSVPKKYRAAATIEIDSVSGYEGAHYAEIRISYERVETVSEMRRRVAQRKKAKAAFGERLGWPGQSYG